MAASKAMTKEVPTFLFCQPCARKALGLQKKAKGSNVELVPVDLEPSAMRKLLEKQGGNCFRCGQPKDAKDARSVQVLEQRGLWGS